MWLSLDVAGWLVTTLACGLVKDVVEKASRPVLEPGMVGSRNHVMRRTSCISKDLFKLASLNFSMSTPDLNVPWQRIPHFCLSTFPQTHGRRSLSENTILNREINVCTAPDRILRLE
jgi:hypothetical protein